MPTNAIINALTLEGSLLCLTRVSGCLILLPMPGFQNLTAPAKVALIVSTTACLYPIWEQAASAYSAVGLPIAILTETAAGMLIGLALAFLFETFQVAAQAVSAQAGFSFASTIDPQSQADSGILLVFSQLAAGLAFFSLGLHGQILRLLWHSYGALRLNTNGLGYTSASLIMQWGSNMFLNGFKLALPIVTMLFLVDLGLSALSRLQPQLQLLSLSFPAKLLLAMFMFAAILTRCCSTLQHLATGMLAQLLQSLAR